MTPEGRVKQEVKQVLARYEAYYFMPVQTGYGSATVDFLVCLRGRFIAIETKGPKKEATARQKRVLKAVEAAGGLAWVVCSGFELEERLRAIFGD